MNIDLHIERLILDGIDLTPGQRHLLQNSVTEELTRLLSHGGVAPHLANGIDLNRLPTSAVQWSGDNPVQLGQQIARSVYGGIGHE
jgi:hypothetical protein